MLRILRNSIVTRLACSKQYCYCTLNIKADLFSIIILQKFSRADSFLKFLI